MRLSNEVRGPENPAKSMCGHRRPADESETSSRAVFRESDVLMRPGGLFLKYAVPLVFLVSGALVVSALVEIYFGYRENKAALSQLQHEKALAEAAHRLRRGDIAGA